MPHARGGVDAKPITPTFEHERDLFHARQLRDAGKTESERRAAFKAQRREPNGSQMIRAQQPRPVLKPSPRLAHGADRAAHFERLTADRREAERGARIARLETARDDLLNHNKWLEGVERQASQMPSKASPQKAKALTRDAFKTMREVQTRSTRKIDRAQAVRREVRDGTNSPTRQLKGVLMNEHDTHDPGQNDMFADPPARDANKPYDKHRDGALEIAIWKRKVVDKGTLYNTELKRSYKDERGEWQTTHAIPERDLLKAARLQEQAYTSIQMAREYDRSQYMEQRQKERPAQTRDRAQDHSRER